MFTHLSYRDGTLFVHMAEVSGRATASFTRGSILINSEEWTATFGSAAPVALPQGFAFGEGSDLHLQLVAPDGTVRAQTRKISLRKGKKEGLFSAAGSAVSPAKYSSADGWTSMVYQFRAFFTHDGLDLTGSIPDWLKASIDRQRELWNSLAWHCRQARRACSTSDPVEIKTFVEERILPAIDVMNNGLGRSRLKLKHPKRLKVDEPGVDAL